jgi:hypothetical protein
MTRPSQNLNRYNIFAGTDFVQFSEAAMIALKNEVEAEDPAYLLAVKRDEYVAHLVEKYSFEAPQFEFDNVWADEPREDLVPAEQFPPMSNVHRGQKYPRPVYRYHLPYSGDQRLLRAIPSTRLLMTHWVNVGADEISFDVVDFYGEAQRIKSVADSVFNTIQQQSQYLAQDVARHNRALPEKARTWFDRRRIELAERQQVTSSLGVPIRKRSNIPATFGVPVVRKKIQVKPEAHASSMAPDPSLPDPVYQEILQVIHDTGQQFERLPSTYLGKDEETLRDHLILILEPRWELSTSTTGETFNKAGKTDILIRFEGRNIFVGECKFWRGAKAHAETIDQLLSYLTWRDSKTAIIYFMDTKEMVAPLRSIEESTLQHPCCVGSRGKREESWFDYDFHLQGDVGRILKLSILCFHFPA